MTLFSALFQYNLAVGLYLVALQDKHNIHILSAKTIFIALTAKQPFSPVSIPHTNKLHTYIYRITSASSIITFRLNMPKIIEQDKNLPILNCILSNLMQ
jgi:RsiW-degrading membrane proteinase PrsW (M82 family)